MSQRSRFEQSRQFDTEGTGKVSPIDITPAYNLFTTTTWPDLTKPVVKADTTKFHQTGQFYTDGHFHDPHTALKKSGTDN